MDGRTRRNSRGRMPRNLRNVRKYEYKTDKRAIIFPYWIYMWRSDSRTNYSDGGVIMAGYSRKDLYDFGKEVSEKASWVLVPGKYVFDTKVIDSDFNQKHNLVGYNPMESLITPFDFTPAGALIKFQKGYRAFKGGKKMISLGISGFGKRHRNKGVQDMIVSVVSKIYKPMIHVPGYKGPGLSSAIDDKIKEQSRRGGSLPSKPKTRGKKSTTRFVDESNPPGMYPLIHGQRCRPGYRKVQRKSKGYTSHWCVKID